jgi:hypothetical protein
MLHPKSKLNNSESTFETACRYVRAGISVIPIRRDGTKTPDPTDLPRTPDEDTGKYKAVWNPFRERLPDDKELRKWFGGKKPAGIGTVGGTIGDAADGLEIMDFDKRADEIFAEFCELVEAECPGLLNKINVVETPRAPVGYHLRYRRSGPIPGSTKLATDPSLPPDERTLVETRGTGGYALAPGSPPECHENKKPYKHVAGPAIENVVVLTKDEIEILWRCARYFDLDTEGKEEPSPKLKQSEYGLSPGDHFNVRGDVKGILSEAGWTPVGNYKWRRPNKKVGWSATLGKCKNKSGHDLFYNFTGNGDPFKERTCYSKFAVYALLKHGGDFSAAAKDLAGKGYGTKREQKSKSKTKPASEVSQADATPEPWDDVIPFDETPTLPPFPVAELPTWLGAWVAATAKATQTPSDLSGMLALAVAAAGLAGKFTVQVRNGWIEPTNLYTVVALSVGERKSKVFREATQPVVEYEADLRAEMAPLIAAQKADHDLLEARLKNLTLRAAKEDDPIERDQLRHEMKEAAKELAKHHVTEEPQLLCDDVTPEKLSQLIVRQGGRMLQAGPEGTAFEIAKGRYSDAANFDVYLKGHAGDALNTDRMRREHEGVTAAYLSAALAVQPDVIRSLSEEPALAQRGFPARFLYALPRSVVGEREIAMEPVSDHVAAAYHNQMLAVWRTEGDKDPSGRTVPHVLRFTTEAESIFRDFEKWLEPQLAPEGELARLCGWANKLAGAIARIAGVLHVAADCEDWSADVGAETVRAAIAIGKDYLLPHARVAFSEMTVDPKVKTAKRVLESLRRIFEDFEDTFQLVNARTARTGNTAFLKILKIILWS